IKPSLERIETRQRPFRSLLEPEGPLDAFELVGHDRTRRRRCVESSERDGQGPQTGTALQWIAQYRSAQTICVQRSADAQWQVARSAHVEAKPRQSIEVT